MKYEELKTLPPEDFRRFCGVKPETFAAMLLALQSEETEVVMVDATEIMVERPKKAKTLLFRQKEAAHVKDAGCGE